MYASLSGNKHHQLLEIVITETRAEMHRTTQTRLMTYDTQPRV